jgi:hypothetical protein
MLRFALPLLLLLAACGARTPMSVGVPSSDGGAADAVAQADATVQRPDLDGHWMLSSIGNCIYSEDWLDFAPSGFTQTVVDRNFCSAHGVYVHPGVSSLGPDRVVSWEFGGDDDTTSFTRTSFVIDPAPPGYVDPGVKPPDPAYVYGVRAFAPTALSQNATGTFVRTERTVRSTPKPNPFKSTVVVTTALGVTPPPAQAAPGKACTLHIVMEASVSYAPDPSTKKVTLDMPCTYGTDTTSGWLQILPQGTKDHDVHTFWSKLLETNGVFKLGQTGDAIQSAFSPNLIVPPNRPDVLVMPRGWYREMLSPPPKTVK